MTLSRLPVILDGDPGLDDAIAWLLALASPELDVLGITAVHGNVDLGKTLWNTGVVLALARQSVPYYAGADRPLVRGELTAANVHGQTGLPAQFLPEAEQTPEEQHAVNFIGRTVRSRPGEVTIIATGPSVLVWSWNSSPARWWVVPAPAEAKFSFSGFLRA